MYRIMVFMLTAGTYFSSGQAHAIEQAQSVALESVTGSVLDGDGRPVEAAVVTFRSGSDQRVLTTADGRFLFRGVAGRYRVSAAKAGYGADAHETYSASPMKQVDVRANEIVATIGFKLWKLAVISGSIQDENGDPVAGLGVALLRARPISGRERFGVEPVTGPRPQTNDLGEFRISSVSPGKYILAVLPARGSVDPEPVALPRFFPTGSTQPADAVPLSIGVGDDRSGLLLRILPAKTFSLSGTLVGAPTETRASVRLLAGDNDVLEGFEVGRSTVSADGRFEFSNVPAGSYHLAFNQLAPDQTLTMKVTSDLVVGGRPSTSERAAEETYWGDMSVDVVDKSLTDIALPVTHGTEICGRVRFDGVTGPPTSDVIRSGLIFLYSSEANSTQLPTMPFRSDGTFCSVGVPNGKYSLDSFVRSPTWVLVAIEDQGRDVTTAAIDVKNTRKLITLVFSDRVPRLSGVVRSEKGETIEGTSVVIFPAEPQAWEAFGPRPLRLRETRTKTDGTYEFKGMIPGHYRVLALPQAAAADWTLTENLFRLSPKAVDVELSLGKDVVLNLVPKR